MSIMPESQYLVTVDVERVTCQTPAGVVESVAWPEVQTVLIETNDSGPFEPDVFWIIVGTQGKCVVPQGAPGESALIDKLQELSGFDNEVFIDAMASTENRTFVCWKADW